MKESEYRAEHFKENLGALEGRSVYVYGTGKNAVLAVERLDGFMDIRGIISDDAAGGDLCGKKIFSLDEAGAEIILIAANMYSAREIYLRISPVCRERGIRLFDLYGTELFKFYDSWEESPCLDKDGWRELFKDYDTISFRLTDTLVVRDMFLGGGLHIRSVFAELITELRKAGKKIIGIKQPELPEDAFREVLIKEGIFTEEQYEKDCFLPEHTERAFREIRGSYPGKALHIGTDPFNDALRPYECGFDVYRMVYFDKKSLTDFEIKASKDPVLRTEELRRLKSRIAESDIISFDIFDTLLLRNVSRVSDVFATAAYRALDKGILKDAGEAESFFEGRLMEQSGLLSLADIYVNIGKKAGFQKDTLDALMSFETDSEERILTRGDTAAELLLYAASLGKRVILISDMYYTAEQLRSMLDRYGIKGFEKIYVSCDAGLYKAGGLYSHVKEAEDAAGKRLLHIGDDPVTDGCAADAGFETFLLPSAGRLAEADGLYADNTDGSRLPSRGALLRSIMLGLWQNRNYADAGEDRYERFGYCALGPLVCGYTSWLSEKLEEGMYNKVLFAARDGYIPIDVYRMSGHKTDAVYYHISRRAAFSLVSGEMRAAYYLAAAFDKTDPAEALKTFYDTDAPVGASYETIPEAVDGNFDIIQKKAGKALRNHEKYMMRLGLKSGEEYAFSDFVSSGTTAEMLEEATGMKLHGLYFGRRLGGDFDPKRSDAYIEGRTGPEKGFLKRYMEAEYFLTSPEPSAAGYDEEGEPLFADEKRSPEELSNIRKAREGALRFAEEFYEIINACGLYGDKTEVIPAELVCGLYLNSCGGTETGRFFDDWSMSYINDRQT